MITTRSAPTRRNLVCVKANSAEMRGGRGKRAPAGMEAGLTVTSAASIGGSSVVLCLPTGSQVTRAGGCAARVVEEPSLPTRIFRDAERGGRGKGAAAKLVVGLTDQTLSC